MTQNTQNGNAIIMILIAVSLFAALGYAFSHTSRTSTSFITDEEAKAYATQIIAYSNDIKSAVRRLQLRGCSDTEVSFENNVVAGYTNPNAPTDKSCHIFDSAGGGLKFWYEKINKFKIRIVGSSDLLGIGTNSCGDSTCTDLYVSVRIKGESNKICEYLNKQQDHSDLIPLPHTTYILHSPKFLGTYGTHIAGNVLYKNKKEACFIHNPDPEKDSYYYHTLIAR